MAVKSYGFAIGNLRARENTLLKQSDYMALLGAKDVKELALRLREKGIGDSLKNSSVPELLEEQTEKLWSYIWDIAPDRKAFEPFLYENDFHNLKAILKSSLKQTDPTPLLLEPASIETEKIKSAVLEKKFNILPEFIRDAAVRAYDILTKSGDTQLADCVIDAAQINARNNAAFESGNNTVAKLIEIDSFYKNIKVALRCAKAKKNIEFLKEAITENPYISAKDLINAALSGEKSVLELLVKKSEIGGNIAAEEYKKSASAFEKYADNCFINVAKKCKNITFGIEPLIGYMVAVIFEIKNLRIIYSGIKTGQSEDKIKERLRDIYG